MPSPEASSPPDRDEHVDYSYRRPLGLGELLPAIGVAVGAGLFAFYITRLLLQRAPLVVDRGATRPGSRADRGGRGQSRDRSADA